MQRRAVVLLFIGVIVSSCTSATRRLTSNDHTVASLPEAGSAHIAVLSVGEWEDYVQVLQPTFQITPAQALQEVGTSTRIIEERLLDTLEVGLELGRGETSNGSGDTGGGTTPQGGAGSGSGGTVTGGTATGGSGTGSTGGSTGSTPAPGPPAASSLALLGTPLGTAGIDPITRHWAATALFQEVQLLSRYVRDVQITSGFTPYVVRLQVSLLPSARLEPYDAYSTVSFFFDPLGDDAAASASKGEDPTQTLGPTKALVSIRDEIAHLAQEYARNLPPSTTELQQQTLASVERVIDEVIAPEAPVVVPLLVTDNLESSLHSRAIDQIRQVAVALSLLRGRTDLGASFERRVEELLSLQGRDLNSLLTVARVSDNTLRVRLGAVQQVATDYAMVPRTHNITVLVLVPERQLARRIQLAARTDMVHARSGIALPSRSETFENSQLDTVHGKYKAHFFLPRECWPPAGKVVAPTTCSRSEERAAARSHLRNLVDFAKAGQGKRFGEYLDYCCLEDGHDEFPRNALWVDLISMLLVTSEDSAASFDLPEPRSSRLFPEQTVLLLDDGKATTTALLRSGEILRPAKFDASLTVSDGTKDYPFVAESVQVLPSNEVRLTFPSLSLWLNKKPQELVLRDLRISYAGPAKQPPPPDRSCQSPVADRTTCTYPVRYRVLETPESVPAPFEFTVLPAFVAADARSRGSLTLAFRLEQQKKVARIELAIQGADVEGIEPVTEPSCLRAARTLVIVRDGIAKVSLSNLHPQSPLTVTATGFDAENKLVGKPVTRTVTVLASAPSIWKQEASY